LFIHDHFEIAELFLVNATVMILFDLKLIQSITFSESI
jgi:hypothetical protein